MDVELEKRLLSELRRSNLAWETTSDRLAQNPIEIQWLPIANFAAARIQLGLTSQGQWVRTDSELVTVFDPEKPCVFLLPVLEIELEEFRHSLESGLSALGLATDFAKLFLFENVTVTGLLSHHSEYWVELALKWAKQLPPSLKLTSALQSLKDNGPTQKLRHEAQKLLASQRKPF